MLGLYDGMMQPPAMNAGHELAAGWLLAAALFSCLWFG